MGYLGIDTDEAQQLAFWLRAAGQSIDSVQRMIFEAQVLSDLRVHVVGPLDQIRSDYERSAAEISHAVTVVLGFRLRLSSLVSRSAAPIPVRTAVPIAPARADAAASNTRPTSAPHAAQWDAEPATRWNQVHQVSSHNSYAVPGGAATLFDLGIRSFELDIHRGPPANIGPSWSPFVRHAVGAGGNEGTASATVDWHVYHVTGDADSEYEYLSDGLAAVAGLETSDPLTIFIDNKDPFTQAHPVEAFDRLIEASLGDRLYRPADFLARAERAGSLPDAVVAAGWPTVAELDGRIIVVITDHVDDYAVTGAAAFVARAPEVRPMGDEFEHLLSPDVVFYNANGRRFGAGEIAAVNATNSIVRTYFNPRCESIEFGTNPAVANYRAIDVEPALANCGPGVYAPPVDTPVPLPAAES